MSRTLSIGATVVGAALSLPAVAQLRDSAAQSSAGVPEIVVVESTRRVEGNVITPGESAAPDPDTMEVLARLPGANVNRNGPLSGQAQYRGLFGPRMTVTVNGMHVTPGGPNWMDSPLHYLPAGLTQRVTLVRGIAPVSAGPGIGGLVEAESRTSEFTDSPEFRSDGDVALSAMSNDGTAASAFVAMANSSHRFHVLASREQGDGIDSAAGRIADTAYGRETYGAAYGYRWGESELGVELSHTDTDPTGTPSLPMDIAFFDTDRVNAVFSTHLADADLSFRVFSTNIGHRMDNYTQRAAPDFSQLPLPPFEGDDKRYVDVDADATGFVVKATMDMGGGALTVGADGNFEAHTAVVHDPDLGPFFVDNFNDASKDFVGLYGQWLGDLGTNWSVELGARYTRVESEAGTVDAFPAVLADMNPGMFGPGTPPFAVKTLRDRFNAQTRLVTDDNVDLVLKFDYRLSEATSLGVGYARKTRSPMYVERYLWIPLEVNSGLGDFNTYVGDTELKPETSDQIELSLDRRFDRGYVSPRIFYRSVGDYIEGVKSTDPVVIAVSANASGDPTPLVFANVDAKLYGLDLVARYEFTRHLRLDTTLNFVRGRRTDVSDDLYRIAPLNARLALSAEWGDWTFTAENVLVAEQRRISKTIVLNEPRSSNAATPGYGLLNLYASWQSQDRLSIRFGVENALDREYTDHMTGFNRVAQSVVAIGSRGQGAGLNAFVRLQLTW
jgi:iron complex outermembrane receptor protein